MWQFLHKGVVAITTRKISSVLVRCPKGRGVMSVGIIEVSDGTDSLKVSNLCNNGDNSSACQYCKAKLDELFMHPGKYRETIPIDPTQLIS